MKTSNTTKNKIYIRMMNRVIKAKQKSDIENFICKHAGLIINSLNIYYDISNEDLEDLFQYAMLLMIDAYKRYDKKKGRESTFVCQQLRNLSRGLVYTISKFSGHKRLGVKKIKEIEPCIHSLDIYDNNGIYIDEAAENTFDEIDKRLDVARNIKIVRKILSADTIEDGARHYDILIDTRPYKEIASDYGICKQRVQQIKERQLNRLRKYFKTRGIEL